MHIILKGQAHPNFAKNNIELLERRGGEMADTPALEAWWEQSRGGSSPLPAKRANRSFAVIIHFALNLFRAETERMNRSSTFPNEFRISGAQAHCFFAKEEVRAKDFFGTDLFRKKV